ncbi:hypothetical protein N8865_00710 [Francisellaceae bacterium]|nr:hypothetical protein [Francisellaceae bacterium]
MSKFYSLIVLLSVCFSGSVYAEGDGVQCNFDLPNGAIAKGSWFFNATSDSNWILLSNNQGGFEIEENPYEVHNFALTKFYADLLITAGAVATGVLTDGNSDTEKGAFKIGEVAADLIFDFEGDGNDASSPVATVSSKGHDDGTWMCGLAYYPSGSSDVAWVYMKGHKDTSGDMNNNGCTVSANSGDFDLNYTTCERTNQNQSGQYYETYNKGAGSLEDGDLYSYQVTISEG